MSGYMPGAALDSALKQQQERKAGQAQTSPSGLLGMRDCSAPEVPQGGLNSAIQELRAVVGDVCTGADNLSQSLGISHPSDPNVKVEREPTSALEIIRNLTYRLREAADRQHEAFDHITS